MFGNLKNIILGLILAASGFCLFGQEVLNSKVTVTTERAAISKYLDSFSEQTNLSFSYSSVIEPEKVKHLSKGTYTIQAALDSLLNHQNINYVPYKDIIILSPQPAYLTNSEKLQISGAVVSDKTGKPVPYATIFFKEESIGTITNFSGEFQLNIPADLINDTLRISSVGYKCAYITPENYLTEKLIVKLAPETIPIDELIVRPDDVEDLVISSYLARYKNYNIKRSNWNAFFREANRQDGNYISLTEALLEIHKAGYINENQDLIKVLMGRKGENTEESKILNLVVQGGLYNNLRLDVAKYKAPFFSETALSECDFKLLKNTFYRDRQTYIVEFDMKDGLSYVGYRGKMYIDAKSLALVRAEFEISPKAMKYARRALVKKSPMGYRIRPQAANYEVDYRYYEGNWNLSHARSEIHIKFKKARGKKNKGFNTDFESTSEFVITEKIDDNSRRIKYRESSQEYDVLVDEVEDTNLEFWGSENIILPEEPLVETIRKLQHKGMLKVDEDLIKATKK